MDKSECVVQILVPRFVGRRDFIGCFYFAEMTEAGNRKATLLISAVFPEIGGNRAY